MWNPRGKKGTCYFFRGNSGDRHFRPHQYDDLIFLLEMPIAVRPPRTLSLEERKTRIVEWAEQKGPDGLGHLYDELRRLV